MRGHKFLDVVLCMAATRLILCECQAHLLCVCGVGDAEPHGGLHGRRVSHRIGGASCHRDIPCVPRKGFGSVCCQGRAGLRVGRGKNRKPVGHHPEGGEGYDAWARMEVGKGAGVIWLSEEQREAIGNIVQKLLQNPTTEPLLAAWAKTRAVLLPWSRSTGIETHRPLVASESFQGWVSVTRTACNPSGLRPNGSSKGVGLTRTS